MSRIGKQPITVPGGVDVTIAEGSVRVKGPKGELALDLVGDVVVEREGDTVSVSRASGSDVRRSPETRCPSLGRTTNVGTARCTASPARS